MGKLLNSGPYADELNGINTELARWNGQLNEAESGIREAVAARDLEGLIELQAKRNAIPEIIRAVVTERDEYQRLRMEAITRQSMAEHEARFSDLPARETITNPNDPNSRTMIIRATM